MAHVGQETAHRVKTIAYEGRRVPIMLQDVNGPCPLLAIANVLLLRGELHLPAGVGEVSQARLVEMVAGRLLDASSLEGRPGVSAEAAASMQQDLADAIALLPQLCTGIDVNLRFHDIRGFEYTRETAVFDLLRIPLVHGWLVDPLDADTAAAVGTRSYNELIVQLVTTLGSATTPRQLTPTASLHGAQRVGSGGGLTPRGSAAQQAAAAASSTPVSSDMLSTALRDTLRLASPESGTGEAEGGPAGGAGSGPSSARSGGPWEAARAPSGGSLHSAPTSDSMHSMHSVVNRMMTDIVADAFTVTPCASRTSRAASPAAPPRDSPGAEGAAALAGGAGWGGGQGPPPAAAPLDTGVQLQLWVDEEGDEGRPVRVALVPQEPGPPPSPFASPTPTPAPSALEAGAQHAQRGGFPATPHASLELLEQQEHSGEASQRGSAPPLTPHASATTAEECQVQQAAVAATAPSAAAAMATAASPRRGGGGDGSPGEAAVRRALLVQQFLEGSPSQLTFHGLAALHEGLQPGQLVVFFRNNHFNTLLKGPGGQLFILATDEGFQFEADVVWEALGAVDGDTQLVDAAFQPFRPHSSQQLATRADAEWEATVAAAAAAGGDTRDADLALAMQLQAEEEEQVQLERQRRTAAVARQQGEARRQAAAQQQQQLPSQRRTSASGSGGSGGKKKEKKGSSLDCCIQ